VTDLIPAGSQVPPVLPSALRVPAGHDRFGEPHGNGIGFIDFKLSLQDSAGLFIAENRIHTKGGPAKHFHLAQEEWFYIAEGEFLFEIGDERFTLQAGDSAYGPRMVPHAWAFIGEGAGRIIFVFTPPGKMEAFFRDLAARDALAPRDPEFWRKYDLEVVGPPLSF
jgi:quercetin dioxygenase-like cupin family protein